MLNNENNFKQEHGHQRALIAKPRFDEKQRKILFEFCEGVKCSASESAEKTEDQSTRTSLFDLNKIPTPNTDPPTYDGPPSVSSLQRPIITLATPRSDTLPTRTNKLALTAPSSEPLDPNVPSVLTRSLQSSDVEEDDVELLSDPDLTVSCNQVCLKLG